MADVFNTGNAVIARRSPDPCVMTIYDFEEGGSIALCNWINPFDPKQSMFKGRFHLSTLSKVERVKPRVKR